MIDVDVLDWMDEHARADTVWLLKRLSVNDTDRRQTNQAGVYLPKRFLFQLFPGFAAARTGNPRVSLDLHVDSHADLRTVNVIYYRQGTRDETRFTGFGGQSSPFQDPLAAGALTLFVFVRDTDGSFRTCHAWVCRDAVEEDRVEERVGPVDPGRFLFWEPLSGQTPSLFFTQAIAPRRSDCRLTADEMPAQWATTFPTGADILAKAIELQPGSRLSPDARLVKRRVCEYEIFRSVEEVIELPAIRAGFTTIEDFVKRAQSVLQRRKSRSGRSLELHVRQILIEEGLVEDRDFSHGAQSEPGHRPDFLFPNMRLYQDASFPPDRLRMLGVKTTAKDRWRQVLQEARRISVKHVLTLQEGVTETQYAEMRAAGIRLVVPEQLHGRFPVTVRAELITVEGFIAELRLLQSGLPSLA